MVYIRVKTNLPAVRIPQGAVNELIRFACDPKAGFGATIQSDSKITSISPAAEVTVFDFQMCKYPQVRILK